MLRPIVLLALVLTCASASSSARPVADPGEARPATSADLEEKRRVLRLASGQSVRVVSRWVDGRWEYRGKGGWKALERGAVVEATSETDLLKTWNTKRAACDPKDPTQRTLLADWAAGVGLTTEALGELDALLARDPDHAGAREVLAAHWFFRVPSLSPATGGLAAREDELLRFGAAQTAAGRELVVLELSMHPDKAALRARLLGELTSTIVVRRSFGALALRRLFPGEEARALLVRSVYDASAEVRRGSALALKAAGEPGLCVPLVKALDARSPVVRANAAEALGNMGYAAAVEPLMAALASLQSGGGAGSARLPHSHIFVGRQIAYVQDFDVEVAQFQAVADPIINVAIEGAVLDVAVAGELDMMFQVQSRAIQDSLAKLTGERPGHGAAAWLAWWEKNGASWRADERSRPKTAG